MGFEIKNICTVVPNPYHPSYKTDNDHYYFSVFITPRLQFDGQLKEFYEMLHWPEYAEKIFWKYLIQENKGNRQPLFILDDLDTAIYGELNTCFLMSSDNQRYDIKRDYEVLRDVLIGMKIIKDKKATIRTSELSEFLKQSEKVWKKLFHENVPVEAWPIYLKPQVATPIDKKIEELKQANEKLSQDRDSFQTQLFSIISDGTLNLGEVQEGNGKSAKESEEQKRLLDEKQKRLNDNIDLIGKQIDENTESLKKLQSKIKSDEHEKSKFRQEFHKKISALARYPHVLRVLGLIQDFKVEKIKIERIAGSDLLLRFEIATNIQSTDQENYPFDEFFKSVQFVRPYTKCEVVDNKGNLSTKDTAMKDKRLRSYIIHPSECDANAVEPNLLNIDIYGKGKIPDYTKYVLRGFLKTSYHEYEQNPNGCYILENGSRKFSYLKDEKGNNVTENGKPIPIVTQVFSVDQDYYEDRTPDLNQTNNPKDSNVVDINTKVFSEEDIAVIKQKATDKPKISKGFSIKVHGQPAGILVNMDEQFQKITDDNIEKPESAFMAHHLDCGYRVDVLVDNEKPWKSLCQREASYLVDRKDDDWKIPLTNITIRRDDISLFDTLPDEPWVEEVRQIDEDGKANRFEEIARWNGWSLTCPPLYKNNSGDPDNHEADDMELKNIRPPIKSLPRLRFGSEYKFRIRSVDICGNGPTLEEEPDAGCIFTYVPTDGLTAGYQRLEPINPPMFFAPYPIVPEFKMISEDEAANEGKAQKNIENIKKKGGFKIDEKYKGEDNETLVIRSKVDQKGVTPPLNDECIRYLTPSHVAAHFAEISGQFEGVKPEKVYEIIKNAPKSFYDEKDIISEIPFSTDSLVDGIVISDPKNMAVKIEKPFTSVTGKLTTKPLQIMLTDSGLKMQDGFVPLNRGEVKVLNIKSTKPGESSNKSGGLFKNIANESTSKEFSIIHATQRPYLKSLENAFKNKEKSIAEYFQFEKLTPDPKSFRPEQKYEVRIELNYDPEKPQKWRNAFFPFSSTGEFILHAEYCDYELNPNNKYGWSYISKDHPKETESDVKENRITSTNNKAEADKFQITKSWSNLDESTEDKYDTLLIDIINPNEPSNPNEKLKSSLQTIKESFSSFSHSIPDTKFRKIKYRLEAVSKFSEFFDIKEHHIDNTDQNPFSVFANLDPDQSEEYDLFGKKSDCYYTIIKNSSKPSKPNITSIVPVFTITNPEENKGTYKFEHKTFRIYLGNTWYETGLGEKIAIIHEQYSNTLKYDKDGNPVLDMKKDNPTELLDSSYVKKKISIFANDPTGSFLEKTDSVINNNEEYIGKTIGSNNIHADSLNTFIFENTVENPSKIPKADQHKKHVFSVFDVHWDMIQKQFYCDIVLNENAITGYTYLLKFAVCRYQEHSIISDGNYDYRLSDVVMTDMISILPSRQIHKNKNGYTVSGREGGRYIFKDGNHSSPIFNRNQLYLISERSHHVNGDLACLSDGKDFYNPKIQPQQIGIQFMPPNEFKTHFIEEYEDIPVQDGFTMDETNYNPRNDPRKRLVFFYKIPN